MRRAIVTEVQGRYAVSERRSCRFLGFERTALRYAAQRPARDAPLRDQLRALAAEYPRWGCPRLHWKLQRLGERHNYKRIERLYRLEGLAVRRRGRKRLAVPRVPRPASPQPNDTWAIDFVSDALRTGRRFRCFTAVDVCTRECVSLHADFSLPSEAVIAALEAAIATRGRPARLLLDNGAEFRSRVFDAWAADQHIALTFIQPGKPIQNSHIESFNSRLRDECLNQHWFLSLPDAQARLAHWRQTYNHDRPHQSLHALTPTEYAREATPLAATCGDRDGGGARCGSRAGGGDLRPAPARCEGRDSGWMERRRAVTKPC